jgi:hypothetical protein
MASQEGGISNINNAGVLPEVVDGDSPFQIPVAMVVHDDWYFLREAIRSYQQIGPVTVFVSLRAWNGGDGRWDKCASEAESVDAEVIIGDWPNEALHRRVALETMRLRGHRHTLIPDGDEIASPQLLNSLKSLASVDAADVVRVSMETYWKSPRYRIQPPERLRPVLMVNAQTVHHDYIREYEPMPPSTARPSALNSPRSSNTAATMRH